ncbi:hypothetical protein BHE74_00038201 [Ensete ventricosum]|nr:hypothetical protein GW17_00017685 [Ensete ventricosum]RWW55178.1 hypothetical protein BHE74_00038201 [Ensete ventricosum]RZS02684.1 hypothetical protein BHM03_00032766 [Ensete ventricosum]
MYDQNALHMSSAYPSLLSSSSVLPTSKVDLNLAGMSVVTAHSEAHGESHRPKSAPRLAVKLRTSSHNGLNTLLKGVYSYHTPCKQAGERP